jgi:hypothetical protein
VGSDLLVQCMTVSMDTSLGSKKSEDLWTSYGRAGTKKEDLEGFRARVIGTHCATCLDHDSNQAFPVASMTDCSYVYI